jgi:hypothetical protein
MHSTVHRVDFAYPAAELDAIFHYAHEHDVDKGGHYDARSAALNVWSQHRLNPATHAESETSETIGRFYFYWEPPMWWGIEVDEGFDLGGLMLERGRLELQALRRVNHGNVSQAGRDG